MLVKLPPSRGPRGGSIILTGGQGIAVVDTLARHGLRVPPLSQKSLDELATFFDPIGGSYHNPLDAAYATETPAQLARELRILDEDPQLDFVTMDLYHLIMSPQRIQGAYIATEETEKLMAWFESRKAEAAAAARNEDDILEVIRSQESEGEEDGEPAEPGERDPLFRQAAEICIQNQLGSTSLLQRRMSIGYGRAARIIDQLEQAGILGPMNGSRPRDVLVGLEELDEIVGE